MSEPWWKKLERRVAAWFGSERTPLSGGNSKATRSDTLHERLYIEVKGRVKHSAVSLWRDTHEKARKEGKIAVCVLAEKGRPGFWLLVRDQDLEAIYWERARAIAARGRSHYPRIAIGDVITTPPCMEEKQTKGE